MAQASFLSAKREKASCNLSASIRQCFRLGFEIEKDAIIDQREQELSHYVIGFEFPERTELLSF